MLHNLRVTASIAVLLLLPACSLVDQVRFSAAEYAGRAVLLECALSLRERSANVDAVNGWLTMSAAAARVVALDCNGDGAPDL